MKEQTQLTGVRKWFGDDFLAIQNEIIEAQEAFFAPYGNCIIKGCEVSGQDIASGICYIGGKIVRFAGTTGVASFPVYLELNEAVSKTRDYQSGGVKEIEREYKAVLNTSVPAGDYITINSTGGKTFREAIQDASNRMVTDGQINVWNAKEPGFNKNTAFNKNFGGNAGQVSEGNHNHNSLYLGLTEKAADSAKLNGAIQQSSISDNTVGRLLLLGAFGLGASGANMIAISDANTLDASGFYKTSATWTGSPNSGTVGSNQGYLIHTGWGTGYALQLFFDVNSSFIPMYRRRDNGTWSAWFKLYGSSYNTDITATDFIIS